ncbi:sugar ABC transporter substrate-binding protein [Arthrobacter sp. 18067]|uniref:ABC transporter substrate-binding protein n=1 Tax=Arthrobacter sp. 18067 TaxID=2681413 RepID=UPI00135BEB88|nr:sugar ABC transporter substrate-binding protein [Arthrobacter sp. 18067]
MNLQITRRSMLKFGLATGTIASLGTTMGCSSSPAAGSEASWSMWSTGAAEDKVWKDFKNYVDSTLKINSTSNLTPSKGYQTKFDLQLASGTTSMVAAVSGTLIPAYAARGALMPLDDLIKADPSFDADDFYADSRKICSFNNKTYALGLDVAPTILYYNKTLFQELGVPLPSAREPMTWEQFHASAKAFTKKTDVYGFTCTPNIDDLMSWIYSAGGDLLNSDQTASALSSEASMKAMTFVHDLFVKDRITPPITNLVTENALSNFLQGNVAYLQNGPWQVLNLRNAKFEWDVVPFPQGPAGSLPRVSGSGFAIPAETKDAETAWKLLKALTSKDALDIYASAGRNNPARKSAATAFVPPPANLGIVQEILDGKLAGGHTFDVTTNWGEIRQLLSTDLPRSFLGQISLEDAVKSFTPELNALIGTHHETMLKTAS